MGSHCQIYRQNSQFHIFQNPGWRTAKRLDALNTWCLRKILRIPYTRHTTNDTVRSTTPILLIPFRRRIISVYTTEAPKTLPRWIVDTVALLLRDRRFGVHIGNKCSSWRLQRNGLPQGSVLSPCLFNVYINYLPSTRSRKFIYADDICLGTQRQTFPK